VKKLTAILFLFNIIIFSFVSYGQDNSSGDFNSTIKSLSSDAAKGYVGPIISSFGSNLNSGWVTKVPSASKLSFSLELKIVAMGTKIDDALKTFSTVGSFNFTKSQAQDIAGQAAPNDFVAQSQIEQELLSHAWTLGISGPTIMGSKDQNVVLDFQGQTITYNNVQYQIPNYTLTDVSGFLDNLSLFPTATIQLGVGTFMGTNVEIRWFPKVNIKDLGDFTYWGFGFTHNPAVWFPGTEFPVDFAVGYHYQDLKVGTIFETKTSMIGIYASKTFGAIISFTPYVGITSESSTTTVNYDYTYDLNGITQTTNINFELKGANNMGLTVGAAFKLAILNLNIDYKFASVKTISAGLTFGF